MDHRTEMREFLASRRARVRPEDAGLPGGGGRRVPGLRREELAALAGVSVSWYTRLERGDTVGASDAVLEAIARTLQLDDLERQHLIRLARGSQTVTTKASARKPAPRTIRPTLQLILDQMTDMPAIVQNGRADVVAMNSLGRAFYSGLVASPSASMNHARYIHLDPGSKVFYREWDEIASNSAAMLHVAAAKDPLDQDLSNLIGELATRSADFRVRWAARNVHEHQSGIKHVNHDLVGEIELSYETLALPGHPGLMLYVNAAAAGSPAADALRLLAAWSAPQLASDTRRDRDHHQD
ncbi:MULTISPECIES: helix-turn-helix transcriptional regulator [unclassified Curtobacterium]|uniref:helix-turn-helix transcriptional regulator n=1 Tax=unclassified Curtobacterium TaxID=257496 RepID=UPI000D8C9380|nr:MULTISPECIES: helix-turn-helix transcriptional regulator [unclassified Curtobacterium]PYY34434.1 transcriptional regulator [Curtobacterium sp. MCPF17_046]WIB15526.1 helix-turn-helix transcriptional regulator [Curtobacterium sp. MCPF17_050]